MPMLTITGFIGKTSLIEIEPSNLKNDQMYITADLRRDDDGNATMFYDMCYVFMDNVPGNQKTIKVVKFTKEPRTVRLSQIPGVCFFGPITVKHYEQPTATNGNVDDEGCESGTEEQDAETADN